MWQIINVIKNKRMQFYVFKIWMSFCDLLFIIIAYGENLTVYYSANIFFNFRDSQKFLKMSLKKIVLRFRILSYAISKTIARNCHTKLLTENRQLFVMYG